MSKSKCVKILEDALKEYGSVPALHTALIRHGVKISLNALYKAQKGAIKEFKSGILLALCDLVYGGDPVKLKKAMEADLKKK